MMIGLKEDQIVH